MELLFAVRVCAVAACYTMLTEGPQTTESAADECKLDGNEKKTKNGGFSQGLSGEPQC